MADINPFIKYMVKDEKEDIFHSSAYAKAQSGASMGSASQQSFAERQRIEENRQVIRGYGASRVANSAISGGPRAKTFTPPVGGGLGASGAGAGLGARPLGTTGGGRPTGAAPRPVSMPKPLGISPKR